jgi:urease accessory protein
MIRATRLIRKADLTGRITVDTITLDRASRYKRRIALTSDRGHAFLLDLPEASHMGHGDALELDNKALIRVQAAAEPLLEIHCNSPAGLARIAWHIGNRHIPAEVTDVAIYIQPDHVLEEMVTGLGAHVHHVKRPFEPEGGAYGGRGPLDKGGHSHGAQAAHGHHHHGDDGHTHDHAHVPEKPKTWQP